MRFNDASGEGYELVANAVIEIDGFNPQIASRLLGAFESWRILEPQRQALAEALCGACWPRRASRATYSRSRRR